MSKLRTIDELALAFGALANPHRLAIFQRLCRCCPPGTACALDTDQRLSVGQLGEGLAIAQSTLSHHIATLSRAGLVKTRRDGRQVLCWIDPATLDELAACFSTPFSSPNQDD